MRKLRNTALKAFYAVLNIGVHPGMEAERERTVNSANCFHLLAFFLGLFMLFEILRFGPYAYLPLPATTIFGSLGCFYFFHRYGYHYLPSSLLLSALTGVFLVMTAFGAGLGTAYIWLFVFPFLYPLAFGLKKGAVFIAAQLFCLFCLFFIPGDPFFYADMNALLRERVFIACAFAGCAALAGELIRWRSQKKIENLMDTLENVSQTDELTGLSNRRAFNGRLVYEMQRSERSGQPLCLVLFDIDHFKKINDTFGHQCGDEALTLLAGLLRSRSRAQDIVARWGGEEFMFLLPATDFAGGMYLAEKMRLEVENAMCHCSTTELRMTVSAGVHQSLPGEPLDILIRRTDEKLYQAKESGRNRVCGDPPAQVDPDLTSS